MSRGTTSDRTPSAAAVPTACPTEAQVAITRVDEKARWLAEIFRPANMRLGTFSLTQARRGIVYKYSGNG